MGRNTVKKRSKYAKGAYHWSEYERGGVYREHVDYVVHVLLLPAKRILDVGAGDGLVASKLRAEGVEVDAIDCDPLAIERAREQGERVILADVARYVPPTNRGYDCAFLGDVIEHLAEPVKSLRRLGEMTSRLVISTPPPEIRDRYAVKQYSGPEMLGILRDSGWKGFHLDTRHSRAYWLGWRSEG